MNEHRGGYAFKGAELDIQKLRQAGGDLGDSPGTVQFTTPSGHTVTTPYTEEAVRHQMTRSANPDAYYANLAKAIKTHGEKTDSKVERDRDREVAETRTGRAILGGLAGTTAGSLLGAGVGHPGMGALAGLLAGGYLGHQSHVDRKHGPAKERINEIRELYAEPDHVREMRDRINLLREQVHQDARMRDFGRDLRNDLRADYGYPYGYGGRGSEYNYKFSEEKTAARRGRGAAAAPAAAAPAAPAAAAPAAAAPAAAGANPGLLELPGQLAQYVHGRTARQYGRRAGGLGGAALGSAIGTIGGGLLGAYNAAPGQGISGALGGAAKGLAAGAAIGGAGGAAIGHYGDKSHLREQRRAFGRSLNAPAAPAAAAPAAAAPAAAAPVQEVAAPAPRRRKPAAAVQEVAAPAPRQRKPAAAVQEVAAPAPRQRKPAADPAKVRAASAAEAIVAAGGAPPPVAGGASPPVAGGAPLPVAGGGTAPKKVVRPRTPAKGQVPGPKTVVPVDTVAPAVRSTGTVTASPAGTSDVTSSGVPRTAPTNSRGLQAVLPDDLRAPPVAQAPVTTDRTPHPETEEMLANMANMANLGPRKTGSLRRKTAAYFDALKYALRLAAIG